MIRFFSIKSSTKVVILENDMKAKIINSVELLYSMLVSAKDYCIGIINPKIAVNMLQNIFIT